MHGSVEKKDGKLELSRKYIASEVHVPLRAIINYSSNVTNNEWILSDAAAKMHEFHRYFFSKAIDKYLLKFYTAIHI